MGTPPYERPITTNAAQRYRLQVTGLRKYTRQTKFKKILQNAGICFAALKVIPGRKAFITFTHPDEREYARSILEEINSSYLVVDADERIQRDFGPPCELADLTDDDVRDAISPLWRLSYDQQLLHKRQNVVKILSQLGLSCDDLEIRPAPLTTKYKGRVDLSVKDGLMGFIVGKMKRQDTRVRYCQLPLVPDRSDDVICRTQEWINRQSTSLPGLTNVCVRLSFSTQQLMLIFDGVVSPASLTDFPDDILRQDDSLVCRQHDGPASNKSIVTKGPGVISEHILGCEFCISPESFFQTNPKVAEQLFEELIRLVNKHQSQTVLLDLCCGTSVMGILLAKQCPSVTKLIGIDCCAEAIADARHNATVNKVDAVFHCAPLQDKFVDLLDDLPPDCTVTALLDPPRCGIHKSLTRLIRECGAIKRMLYIACDLNQSQSNVAQLTKARYQRNQPSSHFRLCSCAAFDMFPQCTNCELVLEFER